MEYKAPSGKIHIMVLKFMDKMILKNPNESSEIRNYMIRNLNNDLWNEVNSK